MQYKNLTPHTINLVGDMRMVLPSVGVARVARLPLGDIIGLPEPEPGVQYIVSIIVAERAPTRDDLLVREKGVAVQSMEVEEPWIHLRGDLT